MLRLWLLILALLPASLASAQVRVHLDQPLGPVNPELLGVGWNTGAIELLAPFEPAGVRIDSRLNSLSPDPNQLLFDSLIDRVARVRGVGSEPLVILYPMPSWLGEARAASCDPPPLVSECSPNYVAPSDFDVWEELIYDVVHTLATADEPALRFEIWNEPDLFVFWHDTPEAFHEMAIRSHRAVQRVEADTGIDLDVGGPASTLAGVPFLVDYVEAIRDANMPLDFVSWHWYANNPLLGPDGNEGQIPQSLYELISGINPDTTPMIYGDQTREFRSAVGAALAGTDLAPTFQIDEWNLSLGGYDLRNDTHEGAAFRAASLMEMERAGLDAADTYRGISGNTLPGDWGIVESNGFYKPAWWMFAAWQRMTGNRVALTGDDPQAGFWARATRDGDQVSVLLSTWIATGGSARSASVLFDGCELSDALVSTLDAGSPNFLAPTLLPVRNGILSLELGEQSVTWVQAVCENLNTPPTAEAGLDQTVECTSPNGATVTLDGSSSSDPDRDQLSFTWSGPFGSASNATPTVDLPLGDHVIDLVVDDGRGGQSTDQVEISVRDSTPPATVDAAAEPASLWPPNHKMVTVSVSTAATDTCDPTPVCAVQSVASNQVANGRGDGNTRTDTMVLGAETVKLRAERSGVRGDRTYTIEVQCTDAAGNAGSDQAIVVVRRDQSGCGLGFELTMLLPLLLLARRWQRAS
jgi:hypothetical protein